MGGEPLRSSVVSVVARRLRLISWVGGSAGAVATFTAVGLFFPALGGSVHVNKTSGWVNAPVIVAFLVVVGYVQARVRGRHVGDAPQWLTEARPPDEREHRLTLGLAAYHLKLDALAWTVAAVGLALLNGIVFSWGLAAIVAGTIWFGGETTCALDYQLYERVLRPVTARALVARPVNEAVAPGVRPRLAMAWLLGTGVPLVGLFVLGAVGAVGSTRHAHYVGAAVLFLAIVGSCTRFLATVLPARAIADPLTAVRNGLERIARGELDVNVHVDDASEVGQLQAGFNRMAEGLRERQRIRDLFGRQVGEEVAHAALFQGVRLGGEERQIAALFVDLVGSTSLALSPPPTAVVRVLNRFFRVVIEVCRIARWLGQQVRGRGALRL